MKDDDLIDSVQELRPEMPSHFIEYSSLHLLIIVPCESASVFQDTVATNVGGHDNDSVLKVDRATLPISEPPVIQNLEHRIKNVMMGFFNLIKENN